MIAKNYIYIVLLLFFTPFMLSSARAADPNMVDMTELTAIAGTDILYVIDDPGGTPLDRKITVTNLFDLIDTEAEFEAICATLNFIISTEVDTFAEINALVADKTLVNEEDAAIWDALNTFNLGAYFANGAVDDGFIRIYEDTDDGTNYTSIAVVAQTGDITLTLPPDDGDAGEQLQTDGSGVLTWEAAGSFTSTAVDDTTWSDGSNATNTWTFDVSGTDHTMVAGNGVVTFGDAVIVTDIFTANAGAYFLNGATDDGFIRIYEDTDDGGNYTQIAVVAQAGDITYTLPPDDGDAGELLRTDGSGVLTWVAAGAGDFLADGTVPLTGPLLDNDDMVFEADADNDGSNKFSFTDGASAEIFSITEAGVVAASGTITATGSFIIGAADMAEADLEKLDGVTDGTAAANKAVVLDGSLDIATINSLTATTVSASDFLAADDIIGQDDLQLDSDSALIQLGEDQDVVITHVADTGVLLGTPATFQVQFGDSATFIDQSTDGTLGLHGDTLVEITAPNLRLEVDDAAYLNIATADGGTTTISQVSDGTDQITIGDGGDKIAVASDSWDVSNAGAFTGVTGITSTGTVDFGGASTEIDNDESTDAALSTLGQIHIRGDEDRFSAHVGAGGEIAGEVTKSFLTMVSVTVDPGAWYDSDTELFLFEVHADKFPNGIIIDEIKVSFNVDPDVELDADLRYADAWIGLANAADIDEIDTTNGVFTEDTDANINGGAAVAAGKVVYMGMDADPEGTGTQMNITILLHSEED